MVAFDDGGQAFARLTAAQRLARVDFMRAAVAELIQQVSQICDDRILSNLLYINRTLELMREDLAMVDDTCNRAIVAQVQDLLSILRDCVERETSATASL